MEFLSGVGNRKIFKRTYKQRAYGPEFRLPHQVWEFVATRATRHVSWLLGATVARLTPDQKVACSNHVGVKFLATFSLESDIKSTNRAISEPVGFDSSTSTSCGARVNTGVLSFSSLNLTKIVVSTDWPSLSVAISLDSYSDFVSLSVFCK